MTDCIFCKIINKEIPASIIHENEDYLAILDAFPNCKGMTLVVPKKHITSNFADVDSDIYMGTMQFSQEVAQILKKGLDVDRVGMIVEGLEIDHLHVKLYPMHGLDTEQVYTKPDADFFTQYP